MRQSKFIITKNHLIMLAATDEIQDELWAGHTEYKNSDIFETQTSNAIGFITRGSANAFMNQATDEEHGDNWVPYKSASAPLMLVRKNFTNFGIVSTTQTCLFGSIQERELIATGPNPIVVSPTLTTYEDSQINSETSETVNVGFKCKQRKKRDLITFDVIDLDPEQIDINEMISDDEIEIDEEVS